MSSLTDFLWTPANGVIILAVAALLSTARTVAPALFRRPLVARLLPLAPLALASAALWIPGLTGVPAGAGDRVLLGIVLGAVAGHTWKTVGQTVLGFDRRLSRAHASSPRSMRPPLPGGLP